MSIRHLAQEIYRLEKEISRLEKVQAAASGQDMQDLSFEISRLKKKRDELKARLESRKEKPRF